MGEIKPIIDPLDDQLTFKIVIIVDGAQVGSKIAFINPEDNTISPRYFMIAVEKSSPIRFEICVGYSPVSIALFDFRGNTLQTSTIKLTPSIDTLYFVSCDHPEADTRLSLWRNLNHEIVNNPTSSLCIHLGDNVYADHAWNSVKSRHTSEKVENLYRERYRRGWFHTYKKRVLSSTSNIMIWDDHEITNDLIVQSSTVRNEKQNLAIQSAIKVYEEFQESLHLIKNSSLGRGWWKFVGNILIITFERTSTGVPSSNEILNYITSLMKIMKSEDVEDEIGGLIICTGWASLPPPGGNTKWSFNQVDESKFQTKKELVPIYDFLLDWSRYNRPVCIVGGDLHFGVRGTITRGDQSISVMVASPITNHPTPDRRKMARLFRETPTIAMESEDLIPYDYEIQDYKGIKDNIIYLNIHQSRGRRCYGRVMIERYKDNTIFIPRIVFSEHQRPYSYTRYFRSLIKMA